MVKRVTPAAALDRLQKSYQRKAGHWAMQQLGFYPHDEVVASFPLHPPTQQQAMQDQQRVIEWVASWRNHPKLASAVQWQPRHWSLLGTQQVPVRLEISRPDELAAMIGQTVHWTSIVQRFATLQAQLKDAPEAFFAAVVRNTDRIMALAKVDFQRLMSVLNWLEQHPDSQLYIRQLPIRGVDTKWVNDHRVLITSLHTAHTGNTDLGIKPEPDRWRLRILDEAMWLAGLSDITAPLDQLATLDISPARVLIVENLISLLTLPPMRQTLAIFGKGTAVSRLAQLPWVHSARVYYWGDLDTHGFRILHSLRSAGIETSSMLMDLTTLQEFEDLWATEAKPFRGELGLLTTTEAEAFAYLRANPGTRLEQERIDWSYVLATLRAQGLLADRLH